MKNPNLLALGTLLVLNLAFFLASPWAAYYTGEDATATRLAIFVACNVLAFVVLRSIFTSKKK